MLSFRRALYYLSILWAFALPLTAQADPQRKLVTFWRSDCAPCQREVPFVLEQAKLHPELLFIFLSLQDEETTRQSLHAALPVNVSVSIAGASAEQMLRQYGDSRKALPLSVFFHADGKICGTHQGLLGTVMLDKWIAAC